MKRAGFVLIARQAKINKSLSEQKFDDYLNLIKKYANDERNLVKKGIAWSFRQIGKRNENLKTTAYSLAKHLLKKEDKSSKWIAYNFCYELKLSIPK